MHARALHLLLIALSAIGGAACARSQWGSPSPARRLYARADYVESGHLLLNLPLAPPVHVT
jgi:hypothetical protein